MHLILPAAMSVHDGLKLRHRDHMAVPTALAEPQSLPEIQHRPRGDDEPREGCQYPDPSRRSLVLVDETAQEVSAPELHR